MRPGNSSSDSFSNFGPLQEPLQRAEVFTTFRVDDRVFQTGPGFFFFLYLALRGVGKGGGRVYGLGKG